MAHERDKAMLRQSLGEEQKAVRDYGKRAAQATSPKTKAALRHARGEEQEHAKLFSGALRYLGHFTKPDVLKAGHNTLMADTMREFGAGTLHSGSKLGPKVTSRKQAIAIGLNQEREAGLR